MKHEIRSTRDCCLLFVAVLLTWEFVAVMNIFSGLCGLPWAALNSDPALHKVDYLSWMI